jgi:ribonuclease P protein component
VPLRLPPESRLRQVKLWQAVYKAGSRHQIEGLYIVAARMEGEVARLGIRLGKKTGTAVERNRLRRLLREEFRLMLPTLPPDLVLIASTRIQLDEEKSQHLRRLWHDWLAGWTVNVECATS